ncbi:MAG: divergent polysaccharide deacetylase family protein [Candidatus Eremiobacteraeota bacterium]|nr:divergent polysaccharide deacetylase family protein [Candidatus Eremiobacteraeota bacterium]
MARPKRRKVARTSRPRLPFVTLASALAALGLIIYGCVAINHQIKGYFGGGASKSHEISGGQSPTPQATSLSEASQPPAIASPTPTPSGASPAPRVAIIIDDCGYSEERCKRFLQLPIPITLSILPMTPYGKQIEADALAAGKFVMLHLPMEPQSALANPGVGAITTQMTDDQVQAQVEADVDSLNNVPGVNNHEGSKATSDPRVMRDVLNVLQKRHMFFIDSLTSGSTVGASTARELGIPTAERDIFLDNQKDIVYIRGQVKQVEDVARKRGSAIAIGHPNASTAQALAEAIPQMQADGIIFVPAESLVK